MPEPRKRPRPKPKKLQPKYPDLSAGLDRLDLPCDLPDGSSQDKQQHPMYFAVLSEMLAAVK